jgi:spore maturation protein CgeB
MLQATDHTRFHPGLAAPDTGHPVLFVGSSRRQQRPLVRDAVEANLLLSVYGTEWNGMIPPRFVKAQYLDNREVGAAYRAAGVVLNDHWQDMRLDGFLSNRLFDAAAAGARIITDDVAGLGDIFGRSVQVAHTADDLVRLSTLSDPDAVFGDDVERRAVAARIHAEHSFAARAERLVQAAVELHRARGFDRFR